MWVYADGTPAAPPTAPTGMVKPNSGGLISDLGKLVYSGAIYEGGAQVAEAGVGIEKMLGVKPLPQYAKDGESVTPFSEMRRVALEKKAAVEQTLSPEMQQAREEGIFGSRPIRYALGVAAENAGPMAVVGKVGGMIKPVVGPLIGYGGAEAGSAALSAGARAGEENRARELDAYKDLPAYKAALERTGDPIKAKLEVDSDYETKAALYNGIGNAVGTLGTGVGAFKVFDEITTGLLKGARRGALEEAKQEAVQGLTETVGGNLAAQETIEPARDIFEGALENIVTGVAVGGITGGTLGAVAGRARAKVAEALEAKQRELDAASKPAETPETDVPIDETVDATEDTPPVETVGPEPLTGPQITPRQQAESQYAQLSQQLVQAGAEPLPPLRNLSAVYKSLRKRGMDVSRQEAEGIYTEYVRGEVAKAQEQLPLPAVDAPTAAELGVTPTLPDSAIDLTESIDAVREQVALDPNAPQPVVPAGAADQEVIDAVAQAKTATTQAQEFENAPPGYIRNLVTGKLEPVPNSLQDEPAAPTPAKALKGQAALPLDEDTFFKGLPSAFKAELKGKPAAEQAELIKQKRFEKTMNSSKWVVETLPRLYQQLTGQPMPRMPDVPLERPDAAPVATTPAVPEGSTTTTLQPVPTEIEEPAPLVQEKTTRRKKAAQPVQTELEPVPETAQQFYDDNMEAGSVPYSELPSEMQDEWNQAYAARKASAKLFDDLQRRVKRNAQIEARKARRTEEGDEEFSKGAQEPADSSVETAITERPTNVAQILENIITRSKDPGARKLAAALRALNLRTKILYVDAERPVTLPSGSVGLVRGVYEPGTNTVRIYRGGMTEGTVLHEIVHAATLAKMFDAMRAKNQNLDNDLTRAYKELEEIYYSAVDANNSPKGPYGLTNIKEFVAEGLTNPQFQAFLNDVKVRKRSSRSLWDRFVNWVADLLGVKQTQATALRKVLELTPEFYSNDVPVPLFQSERVNKVEALDQPIAAAKAMIGALETNTEGVFSRMFGGKLTWDKRILPWVTLNHIAMTMKKKFPIIGEYARTIAQRQTTVVELNNEVGQINLQYEDGLKAVPYAQRERARDLHGKVMSEATKLEYYPDRNDAGQNQDVLNEINADVKLQKQVAQLKKDWAELTKIDTSGKLRKAFTQAHEYNNRMYEASREQAIRNIIFLHMDNKARQDDAKTRPIGELRADAMAKDPVYGEKVKNLLKALTSEMGRIRGPYFHIGRFGNYFVRIKDRATNQTLQFQRFENEQDWRNEVDALREEFKDSSGAESKYVVQSGTLDEAIRGDALGSNFLKTMMQEIQGLPESEYTDEQKNMMMSTISALYVEMLPETAQGRVFVRRRNVAGNNEAEMWRSFGKRASMANYHLATLQHEIDLQSTLRNIRSEITALQEEGAERQDDAVLLGNALSELRQREYNLRTMPETPVIDAVSAATYNYYLALSPAYIALNLLQPWQITLPVLGGKYGFTRTAKTLGAATTTAGRIVKEMASKNFLAPSIVVDPEGKNFSFLSGKERDLFQWAVNAGLVELGMAYEIGHVGRGESTNRQKWMRVAGMGGHLSEVLNRSATLFAAYDLFMKNDKGTYSSPAEKEAAARAYAREVIETTQFNYTAQNRGKMFSKQGFAGKFTPLIAAFQQYNMQLLELWARLTIDAVTGKGVSGMSQKEARRAIGGMLAVTGTLAGALGLPFVTAVAAVIDKLFGSDDEPFDAKAEARAFVAGIFGNEAADIIMRGAPRAAGIDLGRAGMAELLPFSRTLADKRAIRDRFESGAMDLLGPGFGAFQQMLEGMVKISEGRTVEGLQTMSPVAVRNLIKGYDVTANKEYLTDNFGNPIPVKLDAWDKLTIAGGFMPTDVARQREKLSAVNTAEMQLNRAKAALRKQYFSAQDAKDQAAIDDARQAIREFNQKNPANRMAMQDVVAAYRQRGKEFAYGLESGIPMSARQARKIEQFRQFDVE